MDLRQIRYFHQVVRCGSFSKASLYLNIAQPALSQRVRQMEQELGVQLLFRSAQGVTPTEAGLRLMTHAKRILREFEEINDSVRGRGHAPSGEGRFGMPGTVAELLAAPLIEAAKLKYPDVRIRVVEAMSGYVLGWLKQGEVDVAMIYSTSDPHGLQVHHGLSEEICAFATPELGDKYELEASEVRLASVLQLPLIVPGPTHGLRNLIDDAAVLTRTRINPAIEIDSYSQIKKLVSRGLGFGILPRMAIGKEVRSGMFRAWRFADTPITRKVYLAYSTERPLLNAPRAVAQLSWEILRQLVVDGEWTAELPALPNHPELFG